MKNQEMINCERARIDEMQKFSKWLKITFHTNEFLKPEFQRWLNDFAEEKYLKLQSNIEFSKKIIKEASE